MNNPSPKAIAPVEALFRLRESMSGRQQFVRMDRNERLTPLPDWFLAEVRSRLSRDMFTYYPAQDRVLSKLAASLGVDQDCIQLTPGADGAIRSLYQAYVAPGDAVVMLNPSYGMYRVYADMFQARSVQIEFQENRRLDLQQLLESIRPGVKLVMLSNSNQPTGTVLGLEAIGAVLERAAETGSLVALDETYYPFAGVTALPLLADNPHLLIIRSFSKSAGLAGLRVGFGLASPEIAGNLFKVRSAHDINAMALLCAELVLDRPEIVEDHVLQVMAGAELLAARVREFGLAAVLPVVANFLLLDVSSASSPKAMAEKLGQAGFLVKGPFDHPSMAGLLRVTLGPPALMESFAAALRQCLGQKPEQEGQ